MTVVVFADPISHGLKPQIDEDYLINVMTVVAFAGQRFH